MHRVRRPIVALPLLASLVACGPSGGELIVVTRGEPPIERVTTPVIDAPPDRASISVQAEPRVLAVFGGAVAVGTTSGLWIGSLERTGVLTPVPLGRPDAPAPEPGEIRALTRRSNGGLLVAAGNGFYEELEGELVASSAGQLLAGVAATSLSAFGIGKQEEIWLTTPDEAIHLAGGKRVSLSLRGEPATPDAVVGVARGEAILTAGGNAYAISFATREAVRVATGLGATHGIGRAEDGTAYLATDAGLLSRTRAGAWTLRTFGTDAPTVLGVATDFGGAVALTPAGVLAFDDERARRITQPRSAAPGQRVALDANGDTWVLDGGALERFITGAPVGFAADVKPFFQTQCLVCHGGNSLGTPSIAFDDYEVARRFAPLVIRRLTANGLPPMPPPDVKVLKPSDYAVVLRWVAAGYRP